MPNQSEELTAIDKFKHLLTNWIDVYKYKICSYFAIKTFKGTQLIIGQVLYETEMLITKHKFHFENEHIIAGHEIKIIGTKDIDQLLSKLKGGAVRFSNHTFSLKSSSGESPDFKFYPVYPPTISFGPRIPTLLAIGKKRHDISTVDLNLLNWELKAADKPFDSIEDLLSYIKLPGLSQINDYPELVVWGRSPAHISDKSTIKNNQASIVIDAFKNLDTNKINLGCKVFKKGSIERFTIHSSDIKWTKNKKRIIGHYDYSVDNLEMLQAFLRHGGLSLHSWYITDPTKQINPRAAIHKVIDDNFTIINKYLLEAPTKNRKEQDDFELGVASLLHVLGFSVLLYGQIQQLQDGPDIIGFTPNGNIAIIECTTDLIDKEDKLGKLNKRANYIKEKLKNAGLGHFTIQPIIISKLPRAQVTAHLDEAGKHGIAVICKEELSALIRRLSFYPNPEGLFQEASQLIPKNEQLVLPEPNNKT